MDHIGNTADIILTALVLVGLTALLSLPALLGQRREWRIDRQLRDAERGSGQGSLEGGAHGPAPGEGSGADRGQDLIAMHLTPHEGRDGADTRATCTAA